MRAQAGQSTLEYAALLLLAGVVLAAGALLVSVGGIAETVVAQMQRAICLVRGGDCGERAGAPCVTRSQSASTEASVRIAVVKLAGGSTRLRENRSDGSVLVTLVSHAGAGMQVAVGARLGIGGLSLGGSVGGTVEGRIGRGRVWRLRSDAEADALVRSLAAQAARSAPRMSGIALRGMHARGRPREPDETFGEHGLASSVSARLGRVGIALEAEDLLGSRLDRVNGVRTLTLRRRNELSASVATLGAGAEAAGRHGERYALTVDAAGRPLELVVVEALGVQGGTDLPVPLRAALHGDSARSRSGRLAVLERRLDLTEPANLAASAAFVRALRRPRLRAGDAVAVSRALRERLDVAGSARALAYEIETRRRGAHAEASLGIGIGGAGSRVTESLRLVAAGTREAGGPWRERGDCLPAAQTS